MEHAYSGIDGPEMLVAVTTKCLTATQKLIPNPVGKGGGNKYFS